MSSRSEFASVYESINQSINQSIIYENYCGTISFQAVTNVDNCDSLPYPPLIPPSFSLRDVSKFWGNGISRLLSNYNKLEIKYKKYIPPKRLTTTSIAHLPIAPTWQTAVTLA